MFESVHSTTENLFFFPRSNGVNLNIGFDSSIKRISMFIPYASDAKELFCGKKVFTIFNAFESIHHWKGRNKITVRQFNESCIESVLMFDLTYLLCGMAFSNSYNNFYLLSCCVKKTNRQKKKFCFMFYAINKQSRAELYTIMIENKRTKRC